MTQGGRRGTRIYELLLMIHFLTLGAGLGISLIFFVFGLHAGEADGSGQYPEGSINRLVADRLADFAEKTREFGVGGGNDKDG